MKKTFNILFILILILSLSLVLTGCSRNGGGGISTTSKNGLTINMVVNQDNYNKNILHYKISFINGDDKTAIIPKSNFLIYTIPETKEGKPLITEDSINKFYNNIFYDGKLIIYPNQQTPYFSGNLIIENDKIFKDYTSLNLLLGLYYTYNENFSFGAVINNSAFDILKVNKISNQYGPLKINDIKIIKGNSNLEIVFHCNDINSNNYNLKNVRLNYFNFNIGSRKYNQDGCKIVLRKDDNTVSFKKFGDTISNLNNFFIVCKINNFNQNYFNTIIDTQLIYNYNFVISKNVQINNINSKKSIY